MGMTFDNMLECFGKKRKMYIKRIILEESLETEDAPGIIRTYRNTKLKIEQKNYIDSLYNDNEYLGGLSDTVYR